MARALAGRPPTGAEAAATRSALTSLVAHGLVDVVDGACGASRPARRFDRLMTGGVPPVAGESPTGGAGDA